MGSITNEDTALAQILIADSRAICRTGLTSILGRQTGWTVCAEAATTSEAIENARDLRPALVVIGQRLLLPDSGHHAEDG